MQNKATEPKLAGVVGFFDDPSSIIQAAEKVRGSKFKEFDCFTPFPVHGLEKAQGLSRSRVPYVTGTFAFTGTVLAFLWQYSAHVKWWPHNIGGKPLNSLPAYVPIMFELSVLLGGLATFFGMLYFNRLPNLRRRAFDPSITNDRFAILLENPPEPDDDDEPRPDYTPEAAEQFLKSIGARDIRKVYEEGWFA